MGVMNTIAEGIRAIYNANMDDDESKEFGLRLTSGYRCPEKNEGIGRQTNSRHMWGHAIDLAPVMSDFHDGFSKDEAFKLVFDAANEYAGESLKYKVIDEDYSENNRHIHVQFTP